MGQRTIHDDNDHESKLNNGYIVVSWKRYFVAIFPADLLGYGLVVDMQCASSTYKCKAGIDIRCSEHNCSNFLVTGQ